ncbi:MAG: NTP transferase domain-containing protein [Thermomicrobiales bacterium]|nr:NTP transferase domain-containing protein [Thermomicrobiales bacterium]
MDIILPVAGLGSRLRPLTWNRPKPLVTVGGKTLLAHVIDRVQPLDPERLIFITGFLGEQVEEWARRNYELPLEFVEQPEMLGQTDAIGRTRHLTNGSGLVIFPDLVFETDFSRLEATDADVVLYTREVEDPSRFGVAVVEDGRVTRLVEKPTEPVSREAVVGIYYFRSMPDLHKAIDMQLASGVMLKGEYFLADAIQIMIDQGKKVITAPVSVWEDCGTIEALLDTNKYLLEQSGAAHGALSEAVIREPVSVHESATIEGAVIGPYVSIGANAIVRNAIISDAVIDDGATIENTIIEHSVIGRNAHVSGAPLTVAVGDQSNVSVKSS